MHSVENKNKLTIVIPVHNEELSITRVVSDFYKKTSRFAQVTIIICEDGSTDMSVQIIKKLAAKYPLQLISSKMRLGYSKAIINGFKKAKGQYILAIDSDGQCNAEDFPKFWQMRYKADVVIGRRVKRYDSLQRIYFSRFFKLLHKMLFHTLIQDPSCPYILINKNALQRIMDTLGILEQGFWWEFIARSIQSKLSITEVPVEHMPRIDGKSRVYSFSTIPGIAFTHIIGLLRIRFGF